MNQIIMAIVGLALAVIGTIAVAPSIFQSTDSATSGAMAQEVASIRSAMTMHVGTQGLTSFTGVTAGTLATAGVLKDLAVADGKFVSKARSGVTYEVAVNAGSDKVFDITIAGVTGAQEANLAEKIAKTPGTVTNTVADDGIIIVAYNG